MIIGIASRAEPFVSIFRRYFLAAGYDVLRLQDTRSAADCIRSRSLDLIVIDGGLTNGSGGGWDNVTALAAECALPVMACGPREKKGKLLEQTQSWSRALITYPMNPETVMRQIKGLVGDGIPGTRAAARGPARSAGAPSDAPDAIASPDARPERMAARALSMWPGLASVQTSVAVLDQTSDAVFVFSRTGEMVLVNETACRMLGYEKDDLLGRSAGVVFSQIEDPPLVEGLDLRHAMSKFAVPPFDTALRTASGSLVEVNFGTSFLRGEDGDVVGILGIARDIRERRRLEEQLRRNNEVLEEEVKARTEHLRASEARYRSLLEQVPVAVVCSDTDDRVTSFNRAAQRLFGWADGVAGTALSDAWRCRGCGTCREAVEGTPVWAGECMITRDDGSSSAVFHTCTSLRDDSERVTGRVHVASDLSDPSVSQRELMRDAHGLAICDRKGSRKIVTRSEKMYGVLDLIAACANSSATVLIEGESGTGKDLVAEALHLNSDRADGPYLVVNCATLDEHFLKSELFGHERGAFTGALARKRGLFEAADGGTLFVDEVGDMSPEVQAMVLRVLEAGRYRSLGAVEEREVDVRIIAATNKDLESEVAAGRFRRDLFYRLNVLRIWLPPLRERREDVPLLVDHFLSDGKTALDGKRPKRFATETLRALGDFAWPGNVRELRNVVEQARILSQGSVRIGLQHIPKRVLESAAKADDDHQVYRSLTESERHHIKDALARLGGNRTRAAKVLGISRTTLISKIRKYGL